MVASNINIIIETSFLTHTQGKDNSADDNNTNKKMSILLSIMYNRNDNCCTTDVLSLLWLFLPDCFNIASCTHKRIYYKNKNYN